MSRDVGDLIKAAVFTVLLFGASACAMQFLVIAIGNIAAGLPFGSPRLGEPSEIAALMLATGTLVMLGATYLTACGFALLLRSAYLDHMLQIFAKGVMLVLSGSVGIIAGNWAYVRIANDGTFQLQNPIPLIVLMVLALLVCAFGRLENLRGSLPSRVLMSIALILAGPTVLTFFG